MKHISRKSKTYRGFSLVEILMVIVVISILVALMLPAFGAIQKMALNMRQKAQFSGIEVGLEAFKNDFGDYPDSSYLNGYGGAQKLAEAMVGLDGFGVHKNTDFNANAQDDDGNWLYDVNGTLTLPAYDLPDSLSKRMGPYLETDSSNAVYLNDITFPATSNSRTQVAAMLTQRTMVLADQFRTAKNNRTNKKTGMPILYCKAGTYIRNLGYGLIEYKYNFLDNNRYTAFTEYGDLHPWINFTGAIADVFYPEIRDNNFATYNPHRPESFILISAGPDGNFGTADDVYNFDTDDQ